MRNDLHEEWFQRHPEYLLWWCDLMHSAAWKPETISCGKYLVTLNRGEQIASIADLVKRWQRGKDMIINYLKMLQEKGLIRKTSRNNISVIRIVDYDSDDNADNPADNLEHAQNADKQRLSEKSSDKQTDNLADNLCKTDNLADNLTDNPITKKADNLADNLTKKQTDNLADNPANNPNIIYKDKRRKISSSFSSSFPAWDVKEKQKQAENGEPVTAADAAVELKNNRDWLLKMQQRTGLDERAIFKYLDDFVLDCDCRNKQEHPNMTDVMNHFVDWLKKRKKSQGTIESKQPPTPQQLWNKCFAELCQAVTKDVCSTTFDHLQFDHYDKDSHILWLLVPSKEVYNCIEDSSELVSYLGTCAFKYFGKKTVIKYTILPQQP